MICVSIGNVSVHECIEQVKKNNFTEVRIDLIDANDHDIRNIFSSSNNIIATFRPKDGINDEHRIWALKHAVESGAAYVDIEVDSSDKFKREVASFAKSRGKKVIVSYHNCEKTPQREELEHIIKWCIGTSEELRPDVLKIACVSHSQRDNARLLGLLDCLEPMIIIAMGKIGRITRFVAPTLGSFCTFASLSHEAQTAHGQPTKDELETFFNDYQS